MLVARAISGFVNKATEKMKTEKAQHPNALGITAIKGFLSDYNTPSHSSMNVTANIHELRFGFFDYPSYSQSLAPK